MQNSSISKTTAVSWPTLGIQTHMVVLLTTALLALFLLSLLLGSVNIPLDEIISVLLGGEASKASWTTIILKFRLPKAITAVLAGSALAVSGLQMQTLFRNPLAGPFVLGINSGASLGVALVILTVGATGSTLLASLTLLGDLSVVLAASLGSGLVLFLVLLLARRVDTMTLLILGLLFGYATSAIVSILLYFSSPERITAFVQWTFGSFAGVTWAQMRILAPVVLIGLLISWLTVKPLNALLLGETYANSLGVNVKRSRLWILCSTAILAGSITAFAGPIGFIGIAVPHLCRSLFSTSDHRILIPTTILMGGTIALFADLVAQLPGSQTLLPLNAITALIGAPVVAWVILRRRNVRASMGQ